MDLQSVGFSSFPICSASLLSSTPKTQIRGHVLAGNHTLSTPKELKFKCRLGSRVIVRALDSNQSGKLNFSRKEEVDARSRKIDDELEPFRGKPGAISFCGLTHESADERKLISSPFEENAGSFIWILAPAAVIASLVLPQFFLGDLILELFNDDILSGVVFWGFSELIFYIGLAVFFKVTDKVQKPYLQFSARRWSLITGLRGYLTSAFLTMGFKVIAPLVAVYVTFPSLGLPALISVVPYLVGCLVQYGFEKRLESRGSSAWPLVTIIFEVYRLFQMTKATQYLGRLVYEPPQGTELTPLMAERNGALVAMIVTFQVLALCCIWSFLTFLMRLFPSRPVGENY